MNQIFSKRLFESALMENRKIIHVDMDAFFVSVELLDKPDLIGRPVVVGGSPHSRSVVSAASYEARCFGIFSAMSCYKAWQLCPELVFIKPSFDKYKKISAKIKEIFFQYTKKVEMLSFDEAWLDVTQNNLNLPYASVIGKKIKKHIKEEIGLTCSVGVSFNKVLAKLASEEKKPNGFFVITGENFHSYLMKLPVKQIPGIGKATMKKMESLNIFKGKDLFEKSREQLSHHFGKQGNYYYNVIRGIHYSEVKSVRKNKSLSNETTFEKDLFWGALLEDKLGRLLMILWQRLEKKGLSGKTLTLKIKFYDFCQITRSFSGDFHLDSFETFRSFLIERCRLILTRDFPKTRVRLIGVGVLNLSNRDDPRQRNVQLKLFED